MVVLSLDGLALSCDSGRPANGPGIRRRGRIKSAQEASQLFARTGEAKLANLRNQGIHQNIPAGVIGG